MSQSAHSATLSHSDGTTIVEEGLPEHPQRVSALYQYHNAPEVAPAHGLEYDDSNYPHSDKFPVIHTTPIFHGNWTDRAFAAEGGKPPRIIFGMKIRTFLIVSLILCMVIVGAAVGGAVGGGTIQSKSPITGTFTNSTTPTNTTTPAIATPSAYTAATPSFQPLNDCPAANNTHYTSQYSAGIAARVQANAQLNFTRYCDFTASSNPATTLSSSFTYSFEECIESCAALNFYQNNGACKLAVFQANASRPLNCWVGGQSTTLGNLTTQSGTDVALLDTP